jgi:transposase-like protein
MEGRMRKVTMSIRELIDEMGGASAIARIAGVPRTAPYRWIRQGFVSTTVLEKIKAERPALSLDHFFREVQK